MKQLVLLGSGPSHLQVVKELAQAPLPGVQVTWVVAAPREVFVGLLPGWVAGRYPLGDCALPLAPLAQAARVHLIEADVAALDAAQRSLQLADGQTLQYDTLSLDAEPAMDRNAIPGAREHALFLRPVASFIPRWESLCEQARSRTLSVVVIGADAKATEFAFAVHDRLAERARVALVSGGGPLLASQAGALRACVKRRLKRSKITLFEDRCTAITPRQVHLEQGLRLGCDAPWVVQDGPAPHCVAGSGLALDDAGRMRQRPTLQSLSHAEVFGAGEVLGLNLRRFLAGGELVADRGLRGGWQLLASGAHTSIAGWGPFALEGRWVGAWKERRDRGAMARYLAG